jgi:hypothetical protein
VVAEQGFSVYHALNPRDERWRPGLKRGAAVRFKAKTLVGMRRE